jgi:hypothetical protein
MEEDRGYGICCAASHLWLDDLETRMAEEVFSIDETVGFRNLHLRLKHADFFCPFSDRRKYG